MALRTQPGVVVFLAAAGCTTLPDASSPDDVARFADAVRSANARAFGQNERPRPKLVPFRVAELPRAPMPRPLVARAAPAPTELRRSIVYDFAAGAPPSERDAPIGLVLRSTRNRVVTGTFDDWGGGRVFGSFEETFRFCRAMNALAPPMPSRWRSIHVEGDGSAVYRVGDAWLGGTTCDGWLASLASTHAKAIDANRAAYAFVDTHDRSTPELVMLMPEARVQVWATAGSARVETTGMTEVRIPIPRRAGGSLIAIVPYEKLPAWLDAQGCEEEGQALLGAIEKEHMSDSLLMLGVELTPSEGDEPIAVSWAELIDRRVTFDFDDVPSGFSFD